MSQVGTGGEDWVDVDPDAALVKRIRRDRTAIEAAVADRVRRQPDRRWDLVGSDPAVLWCDGRPRYQLSVRSDGRVVFTSLFADPPLL